MEPSYCTEEEISLSIIEDLKYHFVMNIIVFCSQKESTETRITHCKGGLATYGGCEIKNKARSNSYMSL